MLGTLRILLLGVLILGMHQGVAQIEQLRGKVIDAESGEGLSKAVLIIQGADYDFFTSANGTFQIPETFAGKKMRVTYMGYSEQEVKLEEGAFETISLEKKVITLPPMELTAKKYKGPANYTPISNEEYQAQMRDLKRMDEEGMDVYESPAAFPGGWENLHAYIFTTFEFPPNTVKFKQRGTVYVSFTINEEGKPVDVQFMDGEGENGMSEAIIAVVEGMPDWYPGLQYREPVSQSYIAIFPFIAK